MHFVPAIKWPLFLTLCIAFKKPHQQRVVIEFHTLWPQHCFLQMAVIKVHTALEELMFFIFWSFASCCNPTEDLRYKIHLSVQTAAFNLKTTAQYTILYMDKLLFRRMTLFQKNGWPVKTNGLCGSGLNCRMKDFYFFLVMFQNFTFSTIQGFSMSKLKMRMRTDQ